MKTEEKMLLLFGIMQRAEMVELSTGGKKKYKGKTDDKKYFYVSSMHQDTTVVLAENETVLDGVELQDIKLNDTPTVQSKVQNLYEIAMLIFNSHIANGGKLDYSEKEYSYLSDALDEISVGFFKDAPDGGYQEKLEEEKFSLTEKEAVELLALRIGRVMEEFE